VVSSLTSWCTESKGASSYLFLHPLFINFVTIDISLSTLDRYKFSKNYIDTTLLSEKEKTIYILSCFELSINSEDGEG
jgi:hypothetical protein